MMRAASLAADLGGGDEVLLPQRERLRAHHARRPGPAGDRQHEHEVEGVAAAEESGQHDEQRQAGDDEKDVGHQREQIVDAAAEVAGAEADDDADDGRQDADQHTDGEGQAGIPRLSA